MFWLGAALSLCYVPGYTGAYIATQWPLLSLVLPFFLLRSGTFTMFHGLGLAFVAYAAVCAPFTFAPMASVFGLWLIVIMGLSVWFGTVLNDVRGLYAGLTTGAAVSSFVGVLQWFGYAVVPSVTPTPAGLYVNGVQQGTVLALIVVALVSERMWYWALPLLPGIALTQSRGAAVALAVGLLGCYVRRVWVLAAIAALGALYFLTPLSGSDAQRVYIWQTALHNLQPFGWGPGIFYTLVMRDPANGLPFYPEHAHNDALQLAFEYGFAALLPCAVFCFALSRTSEKGWPVVLAFVAAGCYSMPLWMPVASFLALVCVGRILRHHGIARANRSGRGQPVVSWARRVRREGVSVAPYNPAKG